MRHEGSFEELLSIRWEWRDIGGSILERDSFLFMSLRTEERKYKNPKEVGVAN
jgi:hypothetical protein